MDRILPTSSGGAPLPPPAQFVNPITEIAGQMLVAIGAIFASAPLWTYFASIAIPTPLIVTVTGIALCALGIKLLFDNAPPTSTPSQSQKKPAYHQRETRELDNEQYVSERLKKTLKLAHKQIESENDSCTFGKSIQRLLSPIETRKTQAYGCEIGIGHLNIPAFPEIFICNTIKFTNTFSNLDPNDRTRKRFQGSVLSIVTGHFDPEVMSFVKTQLVPILKDRLTKSRLSELGIFNSLKLIYPKLDTACYASSQKGSASLLIALFLGKRVWVANIGNNRAFFVSQDDILKITSMTRNKAELLEETDEPIDVTNVDDTRFGKYMSSLHSSLEDITLSGQQTKQLPLPLALSYPTDLKDSWLQNGFIKRGGTLEPATKPPIDGIEKFRHARLIGGYDQGPKHLGMRPKITYMELENPGYLVLGSEGFDLLCGSSRQISRYLADNNTKPAETQAQDLVKMMYEAGSSSSITTFVVKIT